MPYIIADSAEAAERVHALVPTARFYALDKAREVLADYPRPCRYDVFALVLSVMGWKAFALNDGSDGSAWTPDQFHGFSGGRDD